MPSVSESELMVITEYEDHRLGQDVDDIPLSKADTVFFADLLRGVVNVQKEIDPRINDQLATGWKLSRIDSIAPRRFESL